MNESEKTKEIGLEETQAIGNAEVFEGGMPEGGADEAAGKKALSRNAKIGIGVGCACALAVAGIGIAFAMSRQATTLPADEPVESAALVAETEEGAAQKVTIGYSNYEPQEGDTPVIVHVSGTTDGNRSVDFYHKVSGASEDMELDPGAYVFETTPVLKADGSLVTPRSAQAGASVDDAAVDATQDSQAKPADEVTGDDVKSLLDKVTQAVANGDETLKGDSGKDVAAKVAEAAKATGKVDAEQVEQAEKQAEAASEGEAKGSTGGNAGSGSNPAASASGSEGSGSAAAAPAPSQAASSSNGGGSAASSQPASEPEQPAHQHSWEPVYTTVVDQAAYTTRERVGSHIECSCGAIFNTSSEWGNHAQAAGRGSQHAYRVVDDFDWVEHPAVTHQEVSGYRCACGAMK